MEMEKGSSSDSEEEIPEAFLCCICLELLYKPVVLACGHMSCFWCVHHSMMNSFLESRCPICRHPYYHFPNICQMLHSLLLKMFPDSYERRKIQIFEKEKEMDCFSPQFDVHDHASRSNENLSHLVNQVSSYNTSSPSNFSSGHCFLGKDGSSVNLEQSESSSPLHDCGTSKQFEGSEATAVNKSLTKNYLSESSLRVSTSDVMCAACKQLLCRPTVLNCGHVFCETCIIVPENELLKCFVCQSPHPKGIPRVCLLLSQFLEEQFPREYALRDVIVAQQGQSWHQFPASCSVNGGRQSICKSSSNEKHLPWWNQQGLTVHISAGCDFCGMCPLVGDRYKCRDCVEKIGFDLCGDCYNSRSKLPGRFNQQHTPEHRFEKVWSQMMILKELEDDSASVVLSNVVSENPVISSAPVSSRNDQEVSGDVLAAAGNDGDTAENSNGNQQCS